MSSMLRVRSSKNSRTRKPIGTESNSKVAYDCIGIVFCRNEIQIDPPTQFNPRFKQDQYGNTGIEYGMENSKTMVV